MRRVLFGVFAIALIMAAALPAAAQPETPIPLAFDEPISGQLDNLTLQQTYTFDGRRGEFVQIELTTTVGNLDPLLTVLDTNGAVMALRDDGLGRGTVIESLRIPANGTYRIVVSRFGGDLGLTRGGYDLQISRIGVSSATGSTLRYNDSIINTITDDEPQLFYSFQATSGDILNIRMQRVSGDLDPLLKIVDGDARVIASSDDLIGSTTLDAAVEEFVIDEAGTYVIVATRYGEGYGTSTGSFVLSIEEADDSGLGNTLQTAAELPPDTAIEGEITASRFEQFYTFFANENDLVRVRMDRVSGSLDAYLVILDTNRLELTFDDDGGSGQNALIQELRIPEAGVYTVVATRFGGTEGQTVGRYQIRLEVLGGAFDEVANEALPILYGSTVTGVVSDEEPGVLYAFYGTEGDVVSVSMNRGDGNLDPVVNILGLELQPLVSDDDSGSGQNAAIERYRLSRTGVYYVFATRYTGSDGDSDTEGSYILVLAQVPEP